MKTNGFTKIELLIVGIIAVLIIGFDIGLILYLNLKVRDLQVLSDIRQIQSGLDAYLVINSKYPEIAGKVNLNDDYLGTEKLCADGFKRANDRCSKVILNRMPYSQKGSESPYKYQLIAEGSNFQIEFELKTNFKSLGLTKGLNCADNSGIKSQACSNS